MAPSIQIYPIRQLYEILANAPHHPGNAVAILCSSYEVQDSRIPIPHIVEIFDDVDQDIPGRSLSREAALRISPFIKQIDSEIETVYVCCDSGMSRSSAISAVVHRYFAISDKDIWESPHYHPNPFVFRMISEFLNMPVDDEQLDRLITINRLAFRNAIKRARNT